ncbi:Caspase 8, apoptosis- cysteine peptidase, like 2 [Desmophyllum pertusum]|uniref:Caspase 8, apoptosis- cysteine peptidase, like 2 n=1 Tax=Desmophyllum pertusum TaxID=174260 RepID=A0A9W9ZL87_9CNID|nr:Caspase 8, apoptosis- cysteine peptidase, like 2 [Desmophyllum pertusum]
MTTRPLNRRVFEDYHEPPQPPHLFSMRRSSTTGSSRKSVAIGHGTFSGERNPGFCQIIINGQRSETLFKEDGEVQSVFQELGFDVDKAICSPKNDVESIINSVALRDYDGNRILVCFILSDVTESSEIQSFSGKTLSVSKLMTKFWRSDSLQFKPKIFIIQGHQLPATALSETKVPVDETSITIQLPVGDKNVLCLFVPYRKGYISTLLSTIKLHGLKRDFLDILSEAKKSFYEKNNITIPDPVHTFSGPVYLHK